jgi:DNA mismatch repair ATPase MutS
MSDSTLLKTLRISKDRVFISLGYHDDILKKISKFVDELKES